MQYMRQQFTYMRYYAIFKTENSSYIRKVYHVFLMSQSKKLQGLKSGNQTVQAVEKCRLMILLSEKWLLSTCFTQSTRCGGDPSCIHTFVVTH